MDTGTQRTDVSPSSPSSGGVLEGHSGEGNGNPLQYSCPENLMDRGAWWATVHGVPKSPIRLIDFHFQGSVDGFTTSCMFISSTRERLMFLCSLPQFQSLEQPLTPRRCLIHLFILTVLGLHCCAGLFSRCEDRGYSLVAVHGMGFSFQWLLLLWRPGSRARGFSSCGSCAQ